MRKIVIVVVTFTLVGLGAALAEAKCAKGLAKRTVDQVVADHFAALAAGDWEAAACNYAKDAYLIDDQGIMIGPEEIVESYMSYASFFGGYHPEILDDDYFEKTARILYRLDGGWVVIPDAVDTYVIKKGRIAVQTRHGLIEFTGPPPED
jgi:hypothetical protein